MNDNKFFNSLDFLSMQGDFDEGGDIISLLSPGDGEQLSDEDIPSSLPILPLKNTVLFPGVVIPITIGRDKSIKLVKDVFKRDKIVGVVAQKSADVENPEPEDLFEIGTVARIVKMLRMPDGNVMVIIQGERRFKISEINQVEPYIKADIEVIKEKKISSEPEFEAIIQGLKDMASRIIKMSPNVPSDAAVIIKNFKNYIFLINFVASNMNLEVQEKQKVLETIEVKKRAKLVMEFLTKELKMIELRNQIQSKVKTDIDQQQKQFYLQQQMKAIQEELGHNTHDKEIEELKKTAEKKKWPKYAAEAFEKEAGKLQRMNPAAAEYSVVFNYLELLLDLPWDKCTTDKFDLKRAKKVLDEDHYGLEKVKDRILEYLAVLKLNKSMKSPILCLLGPPGVGKTSLGRSIARSLGRKYQRMSLGGLRDEAEIRGHRRTYIGAMPGRIIQSIRKAKSSNPVFVLDEVDKIGSDFRGDPSSALLEVLDPEQNHEFYDYYLELEYDLSKVMFIATANTMDTIHPALRDRMEVIDITGYLIEEKIEIAKRHLMPKMREQHGLDAKNFIIPSKVIEQLIELYTRESGVRTLEKRIATLARARAKEVVYEEKFSPNVTETMLKKVLGPVIFEKDINKHVDLPGVATGLAWTPAGGDVLYIEVVLTPGKGKIQLTGKLGEVMKESAYTALSYIKSRYEKLDIDPAVFEKWDIHVHVPEGAVSKDGPSAGITLMTAMVSAFSQRKVKANIAMTGEITLRGKVLPVGGIQEKILAAKRFGITDIILSEQNKKNVEEVKKDYIKGLSFHYVKNMDEVTELALMKQKVKGAREMNKSEKEKDVLMS